MKFNMGSSKKCCFFLLLNLTILPWSMSQDMFDNSILQEDMGLMGLLRCTPLSSGEGRCIRQDLCYQPKEYQGTSNPNECPSALGKSLVCCPQTVHAESKPIVNAKVNASYTPYKAYSVRSLTPEDLKAGNINAAPSTCPSSFFRSIDGSCNNLKNSLWGKSFEAMRRLLPSRYADGYSAPRVAIDGSQLPNARLVSQKLIPDESNTNERVSLLLMQFGQFLDHEFALAPTPASGLNPIKCCTGNTHPECFPISVNPDDPFYSDHKQSCIEFIRSIPFPNDKTNFEPREQFSILTAYIDGSNIYGSTKLAADKLRTFFDGLLATWKLPHNGKPNPPIGIPFGPGDYLPKGSSEFCGAQPIQGDICFEAGDERVNEQPGLTSMHTLWMREHNRLARALKKLNPSWSDEKTFQHARRIVIAELQQIIYNEFLPVLLGRTLMKKRNLNLLRSGFSNGYNDSIDASMINEFAAAAYRVGHTLLQAAYKVQFDYQIDGFNYSYIEHHRLRDSYFNPQFVPQPHYLEGFFKALHKDGVQAFDRSITKEVTRHLFQFMPHQFGLDLVSLNIQRGRDHGIPTYNDLREYCGLGKANTFEDFADVIPEEQICIFKEMYKNVDDVELFPAGVSERPLKDAVVGPTFGCIISEQFFRLKNGDRYWYENGNLPHSFTIGQLAQLREVTFARIICDNTAIRSIQPWALLRGTNLGNAETACKNIPTMELYPWTNV